jgi:hypothetical protein
MNKNLKGERGEGRGKKFPLTPLPSPLSERYI